MCVLLHLLICTALRAHIIVLEALYKINYYYYYDSHWLSSLFVRLQRQICLCTADRQTDRQRETGTQRGLEIESHSKILFSKTCSLERDRQTDRCYLKFDSIAVVACIDCKIKHLMQKENMGMLYLVEILSKTLSVQIHLCLENNTNKLF